MKKNIMDRGAGTAGANKKDSTKKRPAGRFEEGFAFFPNHGEVSYKINNSPASKKTEILYNSITNIDNRYIEEAQRRRKQNAPKSWVPLRRAAILILSILALGSATAVAASPALREAIIRFLSGGEAEQVPFDLLTPTEMPQQPSPGAASIEPGIPVTLGDITFLQEQAADGHFSTAYISSPHWLETLRTPSGRLLFCTQDPESEGITYYQLDDGRLTLTAPETCHREGSVLLQNLSGVMGHDGSTEYASVTLPEMTFQVDWQQLEEDILILETDSWARFDIGSTFGGTMRGSDKASNGGSGAAGGGTSAGASDEISITGMYDGRFSARAFQGDSEWIQVSFWFDPQSTEYSYPFLFNLRTGETADPLADIDLSAYPCITDLTIREDKKTAAAMAGDNHDNLKEILIDLESGAITEEITLDPPVSSCLYSLTTGDHTVFYVLGDEQHADGYLYDTETQTSKTLFQGAAWGYLWDYGFSDTYIRLIGGRHAVYYKEPENQVYLMDLADGDMLLLEGIPASHDVSFFWNNERTLLSISIETDATARHAFYIPGAENAWYFDRELSGEVREMYTSWYSEYGYLISAVSNDETMHYLYLYQYTP